MLRWTQSAPGPELVLARERQFDVERQTLVRPWLHSARADYPPPRCHRQCRTKLRPISPLPLSSCRTYPSLPHGSSPPSRWRPASPRHPISDIRFWVPSTHSFPERGIAYIVPAIFTRIFYQITEARQDPDLFC